MIFLALLDNKCFGLAKRIGNLCHLEREIMHELVGVIY